MDIVKKLEEKYQGHKFFFQKWLQKEYRIYQLDCYSLNVQLMYTIQNDKALLEIRSMNFNYEDIKSEFERYIQNLNENRLLFLTGIIHTNEKNYAFK